jgi:hypothetical protein
MRIVEFFNKYIRCNNRDDLDIKIDNKIRHLKCHDTVIDFFIFIRKLNRINSDYKHIDFFYQESLRMIENKDCEQLQNLINSYPTSPKDPNGIANNINTMPSSLQLQSPYEKDTNSIKSYMTNIRLNNTFVTPRCIYILK